MRKNWLLIGITMLVAVLAVAAIACDDDDEDENGNGNGEPPATQEDGEETGVTGLTVVLDEMDGSGVTGIATISANNGGIAVVATVSGAEEGPHANHLHHGTCDPAGQGEIHITLEELVADANGDAAANTSNDEEALGHFETGHYFAVHVGDNETVGAVISCGEVS